MRNSSSTRVSPLMTAKWIYLHNFLTFTDEKYSRDMSVMYWRKRNVSNALNSTNIFAVCHAGSIWSMIDIKGCLRISVNKLVRLCKLTLSFITTLAPIDLLGYFKFSSGFRSLKSNQITFIVTSPQHKCLGEWNSYERAPDSAKKQNTTIYIWTVHIYRLYRRQCAKYTYIYSVHTVYYKDILNYQYTLYTLCTCLHYVHIYT